MKHHIVTSFGGVDLKKDRAYAIMCWYLFASIKIYDKDSIKLVVGAPKGYPKKIADMISKDFNFSLSVLAPAEPDKFCSKIHAMIKTAEFAQEGDTICYLDADVMSYESLSKGLDYFLTSEKLLMTELRPRQREDAKKFRSWVVGIRKNKNTLDFLGRWLHYAGTVKHKFSDQLALYKTWKEFSLKDDDVIDYKVAGLTACHFGGQKFGSKFQSESRGPFKGGHYGAMRQARSLLRMQPIF
jgi:hypothetical protein